jgi:hypothetical protein
MDIGSDPPLRFLPTKIVGKVDLDGLLHP